jgi:CRP/FNR family transcriptional regulator, cyclic AMP receptor protein
VNTTQWRLLTGVPAEEVRELLQVARRRRFARNEVVFHRDDPGDSLHLISKGRFSIRVMTPLGQVATIALRGPGESFGEMALLSDDARRSATVTALEEAETFAVTRGDFERLRSRHPAVNGLLLQFLQNEVRVLNDRLLEALYVPVEKRVLRRLMELVPLFPHDENQALITLTQEALAELAGASRATVNHVLREEERRGLLELQRGKTRILDLNTLTKRAGR